MANSINFDDLSDLIKSIELVETKLEKVLQKSNLEVSTLRSLYADISIAICNLKGKDLNPVAVLWSAFHPKQESGDQLIQFGFLETTKIFQELDQIRNIIEKNASKRFFYTQTCDFTKVAAFTEKGVCQLYFETDYMGNILKRMEVQENGILNKEEMPEDYMPINRYKFASFEISQEAFRKVWDKTN